MKKINTFVNSNNLPAISMEEDPDKNSSYKKRKVDIEETEDSDAKEVIYKKSIGEIDRTQ